MTREQYDAVDAANYSTIKHFYTNPDKIGVSFTNEGMTKGTLIELGFQQGLDVFEDSVHIMGTNVEDAIKLVATEVFKRYGNNYNDDVINETRLDLNSYSNYKTETYLKKFKDTGGKDYIEELSLAEGKQVINADLYQMCKDAIVYLNTNFSEMHAYIKQEAFVEEIVYGEFEGLAKCMLDFRQDNHIVDMKFTSNDPRFFMGSDYFSYMYYVQETLYKVIVANKLKKPTNYRFLVVTDKFWNPYTRQIYATYIDNRAVTTPINELYKMIGDRVVPTLEHLLLGYKEWKMTGDDKPSSLPYAFHNRKTLVYNGNYTI
jgi:hypothetical protein